MMSTNAQINFIDFSHLLAEAINIVSFRWPSIVTMSTSQVLGLRAIDERGIFLKYFYCKHGRVDMFCDKLQIFIFIVVALEKFLNDLLLK